jgi:molecular chaperone GrpE (heat shock protein)
MEKILRDLIDEDIDRVMDNEEIPKRNFFYLILHYLLEKKSIKLNEVNDLATELSKEYEDFLKDFDLELIESNGEIIDVLKNAMRKFRERLSPVMDKIDKFKYDESNDNPY